MAYITMAHSEPNFDQAVALDLAGTFLRQGCDVNDYGEGRWTPLHVAVLENDAVMVDFLLKHGADPHLRTKKPRTSDEQPRPTDGMDAYEFAVWLRDHGKLKQDRSAVIAALQRR